MPKKVETELTHLQCVNAAPKDKEWSLADTGRLSLVIKPDGGKRWLYRFQLHGKESKLWLGLLISVQNFPGFRGKQRPKVSTPACVTIWLFAGETWGVIHGLHCRNPAPSFC